MAIEYLGLSNINGPLVVLEGLQDAFFDEIVEFVIDGNQRKMGRIVELNEDKAVIQVFEGTDVPDQYPYKAVGASHGGVGIAGYAGKDF